MKKNSMNIQCVVAAISALFFMHTLCFAAGYTTSYSEQSSSSASRSAASSSSSTSYSRQSSYGRAPQSVTREEIQQGGQPQKNKGNFYNGKSSKRFSGTTSRSSR